VRADPDPDAFTRIADGWAEWLHELRRLLADGRQLVVGLTDPSSFEPAFAAGDQADGRVARDARYALGAPPAIAGRITTVSDSEAPVSRPSSTRTSSSFR
jgi:hypothetical protein